MPARPRSRRRTISRTPSPAAPARSTTHWVVERALIDRLLADPMAMARGARIVPSMKNGQPDGLKLYAIRRTSFWAHVGLQNGDTLHAVNGYDLSSPPTRPSRPTPALRNASA